MELGRNWADAPESGSQAPENTNHSSHQVRARFIDGENKPNRNIGQVFLPAI
jgi:hypothetical protein